VSPSPIPQPPCIALDLEGPLSPQDCAFDLMALIPEGRRLFARISRYDDLLALSGRPDYEPGDTLALIVPFLLGYGLQAAEIEALAERATLVEGAADLVQGLYARGYRVHCLTTTYQQYAHPLCLRLGIPSLSVACTPFPLEELTARLRAQDWQPVKAVTEKLLKLSDEDDAGLGRLLDAFYWQELPGTPLELTLAAVRPLGGRRKLRALERFALAAGVPLSRWAAVGDSITDRDMLRAVREAGGLPMAFNGNRYALEEAAFAVASVSLADVEPLLRAWEEGGLEGARAFVAGSSRDPDGPSPHYHWLSEPPQLEKALSVHRRLRQHVRQQAAPLG